MNLGNIVLDLKEGTYSLEQKSCRVFHVLTVSLRHKWNGTRLMTPESKCMPNELPNLKLKDFSRLENIKKIYEMFGFDDEYPA